MKQYYFTNKEVSTTLYTSQSKIHQITFKINL